ncbi:MAG: molybdate ABC transporter permease subunit [Rhodobacterales bacterium]|nr:MAG: molybdate ABC transporter permease subunit [Rhodobacterales bacterium]
MTDFAPDIWPVVALSLRVAIVATLAALPVAVGVAYVLERYRFPLRWLLNLVVYLPLVLPPVVTGYALLLLFSPAAPLGAALEGIGLPLAFRWTGAALAAGIMGFPLMVRAMRLSIAAIDPGLEAAAATLGASRLRVFATVTLPLALPGIVAGAALGFAKALGEFGATITFAGNIPGETRTIPSAIYTFLQAPGKEPQVLVFVSISVVIAVGALVVSEMFGRRR